MPRGAEGSLTCARFTCVSKLLYRRGGFPLSAFFSLNFVLSSPLASISLAIGRCRVELFHADPLRRSSVMSFAGHEDRFNRRRRRCRCVPDVGLVEGSPAGTSALSVPSGTFICGPVPQSEPAAASSSPSLRISVDGNDPTQTFTSGSKFVIHFDTDAAVADVVAWKVADYSGTIHAAGSIDVPSGVTDSSLTCSSTVFGYFAVSAGLGQFGRHPAATRKPPGRLFILWCAAQRGGLPAATRRAARRQTVRTSG